MKPIVLMPTYNEKAAIKSILDQLGNINVLVIDDNSPDGTASLVDSLISHFPAQLHLIKREDKQGLGTAYLEGFRWGLEKDFDFIFEMDADFSHPPKSLLNLYAACSVLGADVAVGSRYCRGGHVVNWPWDRILMSYFASVYVRLITWMPVSDTTAGFVCYKRKVLETINLDKIKFVGYAFQIEMKFAAWKLGFRIKEVPITFTDRVEGASKMSKGIFKEAVIGVLKMWWNSFFHSYKK